MAFQEAEPAHWSDEEIERERRARAERLRRDAERGVDANLEDGVKLIEFSRRFAAAFRRDRTPE
jgi:hypothetical protein